MPKLTKRFIDGIRPMEKEAIYWDDALPGYGLRVKTSGAMAYLIQYRNQHGRSRRYTFNRPTLTTPDKARKQAMDLLAEVRNGGDPAAERKTERHAMTVKQLADQFIEDHIDVRLKEKTAKEYKRLVERQILPSIGTLKAHAVTRQDIIALHKSMGRAKRSANQALAILSKMFNMAEIWGIRPDHSNPCHKVARYPENKRERHLSDDEIKRLGKTLDQYEHDGRVQKGAIWAIRLLLLAGCRLDEIRTLRWEDVDMKGSRLMLPDSKTGPRTHVIGSKAVEILKSIPRDEEIPWVLTDRGGEEPLTVNALQYAWRTVREKAGLEDVRLHDLRHTVGTLAAQSGANAFLIRDLLGHKDVAMTNRYVGRDDAPLRLLSDMVEERISRAIDGSDAQSSSQD